MICTVGGSTTVLALRDGCFVRSYLPLVTGKEAGHLFHYVQEDARQLLSRIPDDEEDEEDAIWY